ncbi:MAG: hypothetical protein P4L56_06740 [Candidatus Sulfopaludibacter sp.]|nr:hypothetical protein [Candidatus Sulfopaludibacter sp.]
MRLLFALMLGCLSATCGPPDIRVRVLNLAHIPERTVAAAESTAGEIFHGARVRVIWVDCDAPEACRGRLGPSEFWLQLLSERPAKLPESVLGFSLITNEPSNDGGYAAVTWQGIRALVDCLKIDTVPVLSAAIAHELGHLLLGPHAHSHDGVMKSHLGARELALAAHGGLRFTDAEAKAIHRFAATSSP